MEKPMNNAFERTLREVRQGFCADELSEKLQELVSQVRLTGRGGELVLRMKVKPASRGDTTTLMIEDEVGLRLPKPERAQTVFFATEGNLLQRNDPRQKEMDLKTVPKEVVQVEELKRAVGQ